MPIAFRQRELAVAMIGWFLDTLEDLVNLIGGNGRGAGHQQIVVDGDGSGQHLVFKAHIFTKAHKGFRVLGQTSTAIGGAATGAIERIPHALGAAGHHGADQIAIHAQMIADVVNLVKVADLHRVVDVVDILDGLRFGRGAVNQKTAKGIVKIVENLGGRLISDTQHGNPGTVKIRLRGTLTQEFGIHCQTKINAG